MATRKSIPKIAPAPAVADAPIVAKAGSVVAPAAVGKGIAAKKANPRATSTKRVPSATAASAPIAQPKTAKEKLVRDSFTMPRSDFSLIDQLKERALGFKRPAKKSELLRAGLQALSALNDVKLKAALDALAPIKAGRPKANGK
jgi:hypothetical protein